MIKGQKHGQIKAWNLKRGSQTKMEKAVLRELQLSGYKLCFLAWDSAWKLEPLQLLNSVRKQVSLSRQEPECSEGSWCSHSLACLCCFPSRHQTL